MRKSLLKRIFSSVKLFFILLIAIFAFGLVSFLIQLLVVKIQPTPQFKAHSNLLYNFKETIKFKIGYNQSKAIDYYNYEKCKYLAEKHVELKDLRRIKVSLLNELKSIETKRNKLKKVLEQLQSKVDSYMTDINDLRDKNFVLKQEIANNLVKQAQLELSVTKQIDLIETLKSNNKYSLQLNRIQNETNDFCTIEKCFDFSKCKLNTKLNAFLYNSSTTNKIKNIFSKLQFEKINLSFRLTSNRSNLRTTCLVVIFLIEKSDLNYYKSVVEFLLEHGNTSNILAVDVSQSTLQTKYDLKHFLCFVDPSHRIELSFLVDRFMFASLSYVNSNFYNNLFVHFSLSSSVFDTNLDSLPVVNLMDRFYLFSYFHRSDNTNAKVLFLKNLFHQSKIKKINFFTDFECNLVPINKSDNELCFDLNERARILLNSTFTLIFAEKSDYNWNNEMVKNIFY
jgi:hypothetical protein